jgi:predicted MFS family arabinose efflux permease
VSADLSVSVAAAAVLITGFTFAYGLFQLVHGPLGDRLGKLRTVTGALFLAGIASAACATAGSLEELAVYRFLTGMTAGAVIPLSFAFVGDHVPYAERQPVLGRFISGVLMGSTLGPLLGGVFSDLLGWRTTFLVPAAAFVAISALMLPLARGEHRPSPAGPRTGVLARYAALARTPKVRTICLAVAVEGFLFYGAFGYLGAYLRLDFGVSYTLIGVLLAGFGLGGVGYSLLVGTLVHRLGPERMVRIGGWLLLAGFAALALAPAWPVAVPAVILLGLAFYLLHNTLQTRATEMAPEARGTAISAFAFCLFFGQALGVVAAGAGVEAGGYRPVLGFAGLALAGLAWWLAPRLHRL